MERASSYQLMAVDVKSSGSAFEAGTPNELVDSGYINLAHVAKAILVIAMTSVPTAK